MTLDNFEQHIPDNIFKRGKKYYKNDHVQNLEEVSPGEWEADVKGSDDDYAVGISLDGRTITEHVCTCPYAEDGQICKHIVAVLLEIKQKKPQPISLTSSRDQEMTAMRAIIGQTAPSDAPSTAPKAVSAQKRYDDWTKAPSVIKSVVAIVAFAHSIPPTSIKNIYDDVFQPIASAGSIQEALKVAVTQGWLSKNRQDYVAVSPFGIYLCLQHSTERIYQSLMESIERSGRSIYWGYSEYFFRDLLIAGYRGDAGTFRSKWYNQLRISNRNPPSLMQVWLPQSKADRELLIPLIPKEILAFVVTEWLSWYFDENTPYEEYYHLLYSTLLEYPETVADKYIEVLMPYAFLRGDVEVMEQLIPLFHEQYLQAAHTGILRLIQGDIADALIFFHTAQLLYKKVNRGKNNALGDFSGAFYALALLIKGDAESMTVAQKVIEQGTQKEGRYSNIYPLLKILMMVKEGKRGAAQKEFSRFLKSVNHPLYRLFLGLIGGILSDDVAQEQWLTETRSFLQLLEYTWAANEIAALLQQNDPEAKGVPLITHFPRIEDWVLALNTLQQVGEQPQSVAKENDTRLVWLVDFDKEILEAKEQTFGKKGWSSGRTISDNRLNSKEVKCATQQDLSIMSAMYSSSRNYYYYSKNTSSPELWKALVGHPLLFLYKSPSVSVELIEESPALISQEIETGYELRFEPHIIETDKFLIRKETPTRYKLYNITDDHRRIASVFSGKTLKVPEHAFEQFSKTLSSLANRIPVRSSFDILDPNMPEVPADPRPCIHLLPVGEGFHVELFVKPFATIAPYFHPGEGEANVIALIDGQRVRTTRDLTAETKAVKALRKNISVLNENRPQDHVWEIENADACLSVLTELHPIIASGTATLEWPKGEKFKVTRVVDIDQFRLQVKKQNNWFEVSGSIQVDETRVLNVQELLELSERQKSPFVEIRPGEFLAISAAFRKKLEAVNGLMNKAKGGVMQLHPLAATAFETLTDAVPQVELDKAFEENRKKIKKAFKQTFELPANFNAQLRPYQQEGFEWLHRMAAWGAGACLADDMGLGKTVQALAFLTDRAAKGPALVVAPVSVCRNWIKETEKFAPELRPILFGEGERNTMLQNAGKGDVIIATYDLLTRESDLFIEKKWATIVLDEAQAIKNRTTKRSETAMQLQGDFRLIMSGTPVENHLGELWNLFQFANPGLLGGIEQFNERFALPIEKYKDESRRDQLRRLVQPFILRRRKDEVLKELPAKTEIVLQVELNDDERAFYETLRRKAIENLENPSEDRAAGEQHLRILAEIMKLRRAACHPRLADATVAGFLDSSKLRLFGEVAAELIENGHRALVFSQFVAHLAILREYLDKEKITYQYLDGQTPPAQRQKRIDAFQKGEGDLFLISLKAGGTGLNLTAADYVLHMDPWWNPAVEDQATDRAHRIGQEKPVTVYRLVAAGTIEEKILQLHEQKRDLADSLLSGTGESAKLSAEDLMRLLKERD